MTPLEDQSINYCSHDAIMMNMISSDASTSNRIKSPLKKSVKAKLISTSEQSLADAGERLRSGKLVSFPTETVYGLGCHALDANAVQKVFEAKERPLTDPLIVHVTEPEHALNLWYASSPNSSDNTDSPEHLLLKVLTHEFWPGPLTLVAKASPTIPSIIMANTGYVACRSPSHPIARALIEQSGVPIAAPSANKFGHVSPTRASHVFDDLYMEDVWILDPDMLQDQKEEEVKSMNESNKNIICNVGVESSVAKIEMISPTHGFIIMLRHGAISCKDISECLVNSNLSETFKVITKHQATKEDVSHVAPGQTIKHYSPNIPSYMISHKRTSTSSSTISWTEAEIQLLHKSVIIDYGKRLSSTKQYAKAYRDLSSEGDSRIAASQVFDTLRWSETIADAERVFFPELVLDLSKGDDALGLAVQDRLNRAASGVVVDELM
jgi:tRNA threonylcarbamoyl adenosine modification protein (Sua5/YciO/YrdC/YwlC family)